ncbi:MAG: hypothetical protein E6767_17830 [Dysgonomonas sp.]|nr:hypothetical protein [Dysgonomonas sp.]
MEEEKKQIFNQRKFVSIGLFFMLLTLVTTGILIQIFETFEEGFPIHLFIGIHVLAGIIFIILSILHIVKNWKSFKSYIKTKNIAISKEAIAGFILTLIVVLIGFLLEHHHL